MRVKIGLVGGLGTGATIEYIERLAGEAPEILISHADIGRVGAYLRSNDQDGLRDYLLEHIDVLRRGGATMVAICAIAPHVCAADLWERVGVAHVDAVEALKRRVAKRGFGRMAVWGNELVMRTGVFGAWPADRIVRAAPADEQFIAESYAKLASTGDASAIDVERLRIIGADLVSAKGADGIVIAGTDFSLIFNEQCPWFPTVDSTQAHVDAILACYHHQREAA